MTPRRLVITADDFGADISVNEAVETAHREGVLSAASLMVGAPGADDAVRRAHKMPELRVGLHLVLTDGRPILPAAAVGRLTGADGRFLDEMAALGARMFFDSQARRQLAAEIDAQFRAFAATGLALDHVNAHKHFHLHPTIAGMMLRIGAGYGLRAMRMPVEPTLPLRRVEPGAKLAPDRLFGAWATLARARVRRAGVIAPDQVFGQRWSGAMTTSRLAGLIRALPPGLSEIYLHPATRGGYPGSAPGYLYAEELAALVAPETGNALTASGFACGGFADFAP